MYRSSNYSLPKRYLIVTLCVVNLVCKSWIIRKTYFQIKFIKCPKTEPTGKNSTKFADILVEVMRAMWKVFKIQLGCCSLVLRIVFWGYVINERTPYNNRQRNCFSKTHQLIFKSNSRNNNWLVDLFTQEKSTEHNDGKIQHKSQVWTLKPILKRTTETSMKYWHK